MSQHPIIDLPAIGRTRGGTQRTQRLRRFPQTERSWARDLIDARNQWLDLLDLDPVASVDLEYRVAPRTLSGLPTSLGLPRVDAVLWHTPTACSLLEAKVSSDAVEIMGGIGQLLYYRTLFRVWRRIEVRALVLAAPFLPPFILETIAQTAAPIRYLKALDGMFSGLVPDSELIDAQRAGRRAL